MESTRAWPDAPGSATGSDIVPRPPNPRLKIYARIGWFNLVSAWFRGNLAWFEPGRTGVPRFPRTQVVGPWLPRAGGESSVFTAIVIHHSAHSKHLYALCQNFNGTILRISTWRLKFRRKVPLPNRSSRVQGQAAPCWHLWIELNSVSAGRESVSLRPGPTAIDLRRRGGGLVRELDRKSAFAKATSRQER